MSDRSAWDDPPRHEPDPPPDDAWASPSADHAGEANTTAAPRLPPPPGASAADPNTVAIERAGLAEQSEDWLHQVAAQVDPRLDRMAPQWRSSPQADAARACAFGLLLGYLARTYPQARDDLGRAAEAHPSYSTLPEGRRLSTLEEMSADPDRMAAWLGPLVQVTDPQRMQALLD